MQEAIGTVLYLHPPFEVESFNFENFQRNTSLLYKSIKKKSLDSNVGTFYE